MPMPTTKSQPSPVSPASSVVMGFVIAALVLLQLAVPCEATAQNELRSVLNVSWFSTQSGPDFERNVALIRARTPSRLHELRIEPLSFARGDYFLRMVAASQNVDELARMLSGYFFGSILFQTAGLSRGIILEDADASSLSYLWSVLTLIQNHKIHRIPVVVVGQSWRPLLDWMSRTLPRYDTISAGDLALVRAVDRFEDALDFIENYSYPPDRNDIRYDDVHFRRLEEELRAGFQMQSQLPLVSVFGSARFAPGSEVYNETQALTFALGQVGIGTITGGGPGVMAAANAGSAVAQVDSIGLTIRLRHEEEPNRHVTWGYPFTLFAPRLFHTMYRSEAYVFEPGGFGTINELFFLLHFIEKGVIPKSRPVVLFGSDFWQGALPQLRRIAPSVDIRISNSNAEVVSIIRQSINRQRSRPLQATTCSAFFRRSP